MTAVDLDALDKLRGFCTCAGITPPHGPLCNAPIVAELIAEARKYRALRKAVEDVLNHIPFQGPAGLEHRIRAALDAEP